jgi:hypothetical protein
MNLFDVDDKKNLEIELHKSWRKSVDNTSLEFEFAGIYLDLFIDKFGLTKAPMVKISGKYEDMKSFLSILFKKYMIYYFESNIDMLDAEDEIDDGLTTDEI